MFGLNEKIKAEIQAHALIAATEKKEACGVLLTDGTIARFDNHHPNSADHFAFAASALAPYPRKKIQAIWHSHWSDLQHGFLSLPDLAIAHRPDKLPQLLYHTAFDVWDYYEPDNPNPYPLKPSPHQPNELNFYLDWQFDWGRNDCFALIRRFCLGMLQRDFGEWLRPELEGFPDPDWVCPWQREGLIEVTDRWRQYDILEIALNGGRQPNHLAIVLDPIANQILHNPGKEHYSRLDTCGSYWQKRIVRRLRFEEF